MGGMGGMGVGDDRIEGFLDALAGTGLTPSGGAAVALTGAIGTGLVEMACAHTNSAGPGAEFAGVQSALEHHRGRLVALADRDAAAVGAWDADPTDQAAVETLTRVPLEIAGACRDALTHAPTVAAGSTKRVLPDAAAGTVLVHAGVRASCRIARANLPHHPDPDTRTAYDRRAMVIERAATRAYEKTDTRIAARTNHQHE